MATVIYSKMLGFLKFCEVKHYSYHSSLLKNNGFCTVVAISYNFLWNCNYNIEVQKTITFQKGMDLKIWEYAYGM